METYFRIFLIVGMIAGIANVVCAETAGLKFFWFFMCCCVALGLIKTL